MVVFLLLGTIKRLSVIVLIEKVNLSEEFGETVIVCLVLSIA
jgi:hypothetical protein